MKSNFVQKRASFLYIICLLILFYLKPALSTPLNGALMSSILIVYIFAIVVHFLSNDKSNWLRLDVFFLLGFTIVHLQWPIMYAFSNIIPENYWRIFVDDQLVNYTTWLSVLGGVFFLIGFNLLKTKKKPLSFIPVYNYKKLLYFTVISFVMFLALAGSSFLSGSVYKGEGGGTAGAGISKYLALLYQVGLTVLTAIIIYQNKDKYKGNLFKWFLGLDKMYLSVLIVYVLLFLAIGDRSGPLAISLTILILIANFVRKFKFYEVVIIAVVGGVLMTIIGLGRSESSGIDILSSGADKYSNNTSYDTTLELANSYRTLNTGVAHVPEKHDYFYGSLWVADLLSPLPFAQSLYLEITDKESYEIGTATYITYLVYGKNSPSGEGTSIIVDIYLNFGLVGVIFFMFILGLFLKKISLENKSPSSIKWVFLISILGGMSLYYSRSSYLFVLRDVIWGILFLKFFVKIKRRGYDEKNTTYL